MARDLKDIQLRVKKRLLPTTLFGRSLLIIAVPILLMQMIVAFVFFDRHWDTISSKLVFALSGEIRLLSEQLASDMTEDEKNSLIGSAARNMHIHITVEEGMAAATLKPSDPSFQKFYWFSIGTRLQRELEKHLSPKPFAFYPYDKEDWFEIVVQNTPTQTLRFAMPEKRLIGSATYVFLLFVLGSGVILFAIALIFMRNQLRPLLRLTVAAEKLGKGQEVLDFKPAGATEVRRASRAFLEMKERLTRQIEQRTAMLSGVSHDLRTPITRIKLQLAMSKESTENDLLRSDIAEMEKMIEGYLAFARGEGDENYEHTDLSSILKRLVANIERQGCAVTSDIQDNMVMRMRPMAIERAFGNILSNAAKYGQNVSVISRMVGNVLETVIDDDGPGIPEASRADVFRPFFRMEKSRNKKTGGVGLGLSIAQDIIHGHGGEIQIAESPAKGLRVIISLPL